ncbi:MAG: Stk1 family PASTA domain-containing Ser/Thr kinase [Lactobacillales bacterium]|nr:Stk1 family PASTA domain-containing Ser/Thr kinase [Lactobacillales bacterium]
MQRYKILGSLGSGGMANVFRAYDLILERDVAVKVLRSNFQSDELAIRRFQREALATTELVHPNVVQVYDVGDENGVQYLVMEYVKGMDLKKYIKEYFPIPAEEIVRITRQILSGVAIAHEHGIVHRDLKPQNILMDEEGNVKITDFGIAIAASETSITQTSSMLGSVHYLSPEQARGNKATSLSDIYALGIILYEMMTGKVPFDGESAVTIALKHFQENLPEVSEINPEIPKSLENVVLIATSKEISKRYPTVAAMSEDLASVLSPARVNESRVSLGETKTIKKQFTKPEKEGFESAKEQNDEDLLDQQIINFYRRGKSTKKIAAELLLPVDQVEDRLRLLAKKGKIQYPKKNGKKIWVISAIVSIVLILIIFLILLGGSPKDIEVPNLKDCTEAEAREKLSKLELDVNKIIDVENTDVDKGKVVKTDPKANTMVKEGRKIILYISSGVKKIELKDYTGKSFDKVKEDLVLKGYDSQLIVKREEANEDVEEGSIIRQSLQEGEKVDPTKDRIVFTVSNGSNLVTLGDYKGQFLNNVKSALHGLGLKESQIQVKYETDTKSSAGMVVRVDPGSGASVNKERGKVTLYVSDGKVTIPKGLQGNSEMNAKLALEDAGLNVNSVRENSDSVSKDYVISIEPSSGQVDLGSTVTLKISNGSLSSSSSSSSSSSLSGGH